eukprot:935238-Amphidinium_carterae.1
MSRTWKQDLFTKDVDRKRAEKLQSQIQHYRNRYGALMQRNEQRRSQRKRGEPAEPDEALPPPPDPPDGFEPFTADERKTISENT